MMRAETLAPAPARLRTAAARLRGPAGPVASGRPGVAFHGLLGRTPAMRQLFATIERFAPHARTTLITGEIGTGKGAVARTLYHLGPRRGGAFVPVACADLADDASGWTARLSSTADGEATCYFADVADLPGVEQLRLARLLAAGDVWGAARPDVHVIAATAHDLEAAMAAGRFRSDLYYRLGVFALHVPPLRERLDDLPDLAAAFLREISARLRLVGRGLTPGATRVLQAHGWPGNLRELRNVLERAAVLSDQDVVGESAVRAALAATAPARPVATAVAADDAAAGRLDAAQRAHVRAVLHGVGGNKTAAAATLGISRRALYRLIDRLGA